MAEDTVVDRMVVELETNLEDALRGFDKAEQSSDQLERQLEQVEKQSKDTAKSLDKTGDESKDTAKEVDKLTKSTKEEGKAAEIAGDKTDKARMDIQKEGDAAKNSAKKNETLTDSFKNMNIAGIGVIAAITAVVAAVVKIGEAAIESATKFDNSLAQMQISTGATGANLEALSGVVDNLYGSFPAELETITTVVGNLNTAYGLQGDALESLSRSYLSVAKVTGGDVAGQIDTAREVFNKFGVAVEDQSEYLTYFQSVSQNTGVAFDVLMSLLAEGDRGFQLLGLNAKQSADVIGKSVQKDGVKAAQELVSALEIGLAKSANTAEAAVKSAETALATANKEYSALIASDSTDAINAALEARIAAEQAYQNAVKSGDTTSLDAMSSALESANETYNSLLEDRNDAINAAREKQIEAQKTYDKALKGVSGTVIEENLLKTIELMRNANSESDALVIGMETFGVTLSGKVAGALFAGVIDPEVEEKNQDSIKTVEQLVEETITLDDKMLMLRADMDKALAPLGDYLLDTFDETSPAIEDALYWLNIFLENLDTVKEIGTTFIPLFHIMDTLSGWFSENGSEIIGYLVTIISRMNDIGGDSGGVMNMLQTIWSFVDTYILTLLDSILIALAFLAGDTDTALLKTYEVAIRWGKTFGIFVENGINSILGKISDAGNSVLDFTDSIANGIITMFEDAVNSVINAINTLISGYNSVASALSLPTLPTLATVEIERVQHETVDIQYSGISNALAELEQTYADLQAEVEYRKELNAALKEAETSGNTQEVERIKTIIQELNASGVLTGTSTGTTNEDIMGIRTTPSVEIGELNVYSPAADASTMMNTTRRTLRGVGGMIV